jgi:hypothetical protein
MCMFTHTNMYIYTYTYIYIYIQYICIYIHVYICIYISTYICYDWFPSAPWPRMWAMTYSYVSDDLFLCVPWLIAVCAITHAYVFHDSFICTTWLNLAYAYPPAPINHVKYSRAVPPKCLFKTGTPPIQIISVFHISVKRNSKTQMTEFCQAEIQNTTGLSNKPSTTKFCVEDQILENKMLGTGS